MTNRPDDKQSQMLFEEDETQTEIIQSFGDEQFINDRFKHLTEDVGVDESDARSVISTEFDHFLYADAISQPIDIRESKALFEASPFTEEPDPALVFRSLDRMSQFSTVQRDYGETAVDEEPQLDDLETPQDATQLIEFNEDSQVTDPKKPSSLTRVTTGPTLGVTHRETNVRTDTTEIERVGFEEEATDSLDIGAFQDERTRPYELPPYARQTTPCHQLQSVSRERPEELYATDELYLGSLRNEVITTPRDDLAELETEERSRGMIAGGGDLVVCGVDSVLGDVDSVVHAGKDHLLKSPCSPEVHNHEEILPVAFSVSAADLGIIRKKSVGEFIESDDKDERRPDVFFDFDFIEEISPVEQPSSVGVQRISHRNLDDDEFYSLKITLPFKIMIAQEDLPEGITLSTLTKEEKDSVFPLPKKQHSPNVLEKRTFILRDLPRKATVFSLSTLLIAILSVAVIILLILVIRLS